jgi:uncharacterized membrane protein
MKMFIVNLFIGFVVMSMLRHAGYRGLRAWVGLLIVAIIVALVETIFIEDKDETSM